MCTGRYVSEIGAYDNGADFPASTPTFMHHLGRAGYEVLLSGKMHFIGPDQRHGFHRRLTPEIYPSGFTWTPDWNDGARHNPGTAVNQLHEAGLCDWNLQLDYDEEVRFRSLEALRDLARQNVDERKPFFLCAALPIRTTLTSPPKSGGISTTTTRSIRRPRPLRQASKRCIPTTSGCRSIT